MEHWCSLEHGSCHHHRPPFLQLGRQSEGKRSDLERQAAARDRLCPGCCGVKPPSASKGQGIEDQTLPALPVGAMMWELRPAAPNLLSLVQDKAHRCRRQQRHRPLARWERHIRWLLLGVCKGCGGRRVPDSPGRLGLAAEPKESQPLLAMGGLCHTTFSPKTEPQVTDRHSVTCLGNVAASWMPWCVSQGLFRG